MSATRNAYRPDPTSYTTRSPRTPINRTDSARLATTALVTPISRTIAALAAGTYTTPVAFAGTTTSSSRPFPERFHRTLTVPRTLSYDADTLSLPGADTF